MRSILISLFVVLTVTACPAWLAPPPTAGAGASSPCSSDFECASGLACECGVCAEPTGQPPRCIDLDDACDDTPSDCFAACGNLSVVGQAECVGGRETCSTVDGVLRSQCDADTCWGELQPGEICLDGQFECEFPPRLPNGDCYTFDCDAALAGECVTACGDGSIPTPQICIASEWQCQNGVPTGECGECVGAAPACVLTCGDLTTVGSAACDGTVLEWSCAHIVQNGTPASLSTDCGCANGAVVSDVEDVAALDGVTCVIGNLSFGNGTATNVTLDSLAVVTADLFVPSQNLEELHLPQLSRVGRTLSVGGATSLRTFDAPALEEVGTTFSFVSNPLLPTCDILELLSRVEADGPVPSVTVLDNGPCTDGGPDDDAGTTDGGVVDAGSVDGGPEDSGTVDASVTDDSGMSPDGGAVDGGDAG